MPLFGEINVEILNVVSLFRILNQRIRRFQDIQESRQITTGFITFKECDQILQGSSMW